MTFKSESVISVCSVSWGKDSILYTVHAGKRAQDSVRAVPKGLHFTASIPFSDQAIL